MDIIVIDIPWLKRLRARKQLPAVECTKAQARDYFAGYWTGLALGVVIGAALAVLVVAS